MKKSLKIISQRILSIILFLLISAVMIVPFGVVYLFYGIDKAFDMIEVFEDLFIKKL